MLSGCLSLLVPLYYLHLSPTVLVVSGSTDVSLHFVTRCAYRPIGGIRLFGCPSLNYLFGYICVPVVSGSPDVSLPFSPFICLPVCLLVSGSPDGLLHFSCLPSSVSLMVSGDTVVFC